MKLCITSTGKDLDAKVDTRFGRAPFFLIIDTGTNAIEAIDNSGAAQLQGAGIAAAQLISGKGVDALLTGSVGPNASGVLQQTNIKVYEGASSQDTIKEALAKFHQGKFNTAQVMPAEDLPPGQRQGRGFGQGRGLGQGRGMGRGRGRRRQT